jgi:hypothetical protein
MRNLLCILALLCLPLPCAATAYYLANASTSPVGNDSNTGTDAAHPWLSPNHAVNCGDTITAVASTSYSSANFASGKWGVVTCAGGNNVAWVICATFDGCKISGGSSDAMKISASYWGVQGWETTSTTGACFAISPPSTTTIHHIILANDVCNGAGSGFNAFNNGSASVDYLIYLGDIAYNAAQSTSECTSAFSLWEPLNSDTKIGTHIYWAGNFAFGNVEPAICASVAASDGEGFIIDTLDGGTYNGQVVLDNNISVFNGGRAVEILLNTVNSPLPRVFVRGTTAYYNGQQNYSGSFYACGDMLIDSAYSTEISNTLITSTAAAACGGNNVASFLVLDGNGTDFVYNNYGYTSLGAGYFTYSAGGSGFAFGPNNTLTDPVFANPVSPGAPSCSGKTNTVDCMSTVIANFTPTVTAAKLYGYQIPSTTSRYDPLYPPWLCSVTNLPTGLQTPGCVIAGMPGSGTASFK